jgi:hypothetical protein
MEITQEIAQKVLNTVNAGLVYGLGNPIPGQMCVEAAVCYAMGLPHSANPPCVSPALRDLKIVLNDSNWSSNLARTNGLRKLALLQLGTDGVLDEVEFAKKLSLLVINNYLPPILRKVNLSQEADACEQAKDLVTARNAARAAAYAVDSANAARAAAYDAGDDAGDTTCSAVSVISDDAVSAIDDEDAVAYAVYVIRNISNITKDDKTLLSFAKDVAEILIDMKVPGVQWLSLLAE